MSNQRQQHSLIPVQSLSGIAQVESIFTTASGDFPNNDNCGKKPQQARNGGKAAQQLRNTVQQQRQLVLPESHHQAKSTEEAQHQQKQEQPQVKPSRRRSSTLPIIISNEELVHQFLSCLSESQHTAIISHLQSLTHLEAATTAFSKMKPSNAPNRLAAVPVCHFPKTREAILALLGPETDSGTFPRSLLSSGLTTRLGVTVSKNVPETYLGKQRTRDELDHDSFRVKTEEHGGLAGRFASLKVREIREQYGIGNNQNNRNRQRNGGQNDDDDEDEDDEDNDPEDLSRVSLKNLPSGQELEDFPDVLREGIRVAAVAVMQRVLGPRLKYLICRQRRMNVMSQDLGFGGGSGASSGVGASSGKQLPHHHQQQQQQGSLIAKQHSLAHIHQMVLDAMRRGCSPLQFCVSSSSSSSSQQQQQQQAPTTTAGALGRRGSLAASSAAMFSAGAAAASSSDHNVFQQQLQQQHATTTAAKFALGLQFPTPADFATSIGSSTTNANAVHSSIAKNYSGPTAPVAASFFASWHLEGLHSLLHHGFLVVVPAGTQLCFQGAPVVTGRAQAMLADSPSVIVVMMGVVQAVVNSILPCCDAGHFISKDCFNGTANNNMNNSKTTSSTTTNNLLELAMMSTSQQQQQAAVDDAKSQEQKALLRRQQAWEGFYRVKQQQQNQQNQQQSQQQQQHQGGSSSSNVLLHRGDDSSAAGGAAAAVASV